MLLLIYYDLTVFSRKFQSGLFREQLKYLINGLLYAVQVNLLFEIHIGFVVMETETCFGGNFSKHLFHVLIPDLDGETDVFSILRLGISTGGVRSRQCNGQRKSH